MKNDEADSTGVAARRPGKESKRGVADTGLRARNTPPPQPSPTPTPPADAAAQPAAASTAATR